MQCIASSEVTESCRPPNFRNPIEKGKKIILKNKNTSFVKKRYKKNQTSPYSAYQLSTKKKLF